MESAEEKAMSKKRRRRRRKEPPETDPALLETYLSDPITLWQDGEYEALDALYAQPNKEHTDRHVEPKPTETEVAQDEDDSLPF